MGGVVRRGGELVEFRPLAQQDLPWRFAARIRRAHCSMRIGFSLSRRVSKCLLRAKHSIQWFSHGSFVLRPHFLRHWAV